MYLVPMLLSAVAASRVTRLDSSSAAVANLLLLFLAQAVTAMRLLAAVRAILLSIPYTSL
jgi:hypothetical protein